MLQMQQYIQNCHMPLTPKAVNNDEKAGLLTRSFQVPSHSNKFGAVTYYLKLAELTAAGTVPDLNRIPF